MKNKGLSLLAILFLMAFFNACDYEFIQPKKIVVNDVSFKNAVVPIFNQKCNMSGCHTVGHFKVDLTPENAYNDLFAKNLINKVKPEESKIYVKLLSTSGIHAGKTTPTEQSTILKWIQEGAKDN